MSKKHGVIVRMNEDTLKKAISGKVTMRLPEGNIIDMRWVPERDCFDVKIHGDLLPEVMPGEMYPIWDCECTERLC